MHVKSRRLNRCGGVYIAVLGTSLIVALLGISALIGQRIQNRIVTASVDIRQAQLNAATAAELGLLAIKQETNWRSVRANGSWFANRGTGAGTCSLSVTDPIDGNLANNANDPVEVLGIGYRGQAVQRLRLMLDARPEPLSSLHSCVAAGDTIDLQSDTLRTNGLITANQSTASSAAIYGNVEAVTISGSTYNGTTTQVTSAKRPTMPTWSSVFDYYRTNGTEINIANLPTTTPNLGRNISFDVNADNWTGTATGLPTASITREVNIGGHAASLRIHNRTAITAGASQSIDHIVKSGASYNISIQVYVNVGLGNAFRVKLATKGSGSVQTATSAVQLLADGEWHTIDVALTAPDWSGELEYARITIDTDHVWGSTNGFYIDNIDVREITTGRFIYRQVLSPSINPFGATTNTQGVYWINCNGNRLVIERSRILGTLLIVNPGANSCVSNGPIHWSPAVAGYPALLVDADTATEADFAINATNRGLGEKENGTNYNPSGASHAQLGEDSDFSDIYQSEIRGLIAIEDDLTYQNRPLIRGQILVGDDIANSSGTLEVEYLPESVLNPPPGFSAPNTYSRRPNSAQKAVLP